MRKIAVALALAALVVPARGRAAAPHQVRPEHDLMRYGVVLSVPGMDRVRIDKDVTYKTAAGQILQMDVYSPPEALPKGGTRPAVVFVNGVGDWPGGRKLRTWGQYTSWPRLIAASGMVAVTFDARGDAANVEDVRDAFAFLRDKGRSMGIDPERIAAWACSANVRSALAALMVPGPAAAQVAVFYYGAGEVAEARADLPVLYVRAGRDRPQMNEQVDALASRMIAANAPWTVVNLPNAHHAFDVFDDTEESRVAIRRTLRFLQDRLEPAPASARPPSDALAAQVHLMSGEWAEAEAAYTAYVARHPDDVDALVFLAQAQVETHRPNEAAANLKKAVALDPEFAAAWATLGRIEADEKDYPAALEALTKAVTLAPDDGEARFQLGKAQLAAHDAPAAAATLERAVELNPGNGWAWNSLAYAYLATKQPAKAAGAFERVLPYAPTNPTLLYNAACAHALSGDTSKALDLLDRAIAAGFKDKAGLMSDPDLAGVRSDPRFAEIVKKLG